MNDTDTKVTSVDGPHALRENASLLLRLRWVAVVGQLVTIAIAKFLLHVELRLLPLLAIIGLTATTNLIFALWLRTYRESDRNECQAIVGQATLAAVLALDLLALTGLLYFAGGAANPFSIFYLVNLTLCAMLLPEGWGWALAALAAAGLTLLFFKHVPIPELHEAANALPDRKWMHLSLEQWGRVVATIGCALVIIHFVAWITRQLEVTASELQRMERERSRSEKLEALGTFSAGAAHELATPLSTIAVVASDLVRNLNQPGLADAVREDALLIRSEVDHCQMILRRMRAHAGQFMAEKILPTTVQDLIQTTLSELSEANHVDLQLAPGAEEVQLVLPTDSMAQALRGLLQNALDATQPNPHVSMKVDWDSRVVRLVIRDQGPGMSEEAVERAGEPFFTTKEPGRGMGLGLFLTRSVIERLGGRLQIESVAGQGVIARVDLPRQPNSSVRA